jgi:polyhydroxybutyrate depolymerase
MRWVWAALLLGLAAAQAQTPCGVETPCQLATGTYRAAPPPGWDGRTPLPTALHFHGARGSAAEGMADDTLREAFAAAGVLLILPDGIDGGWAFRGGWRAGRDDIAFTRDILADIRTRWTIDENQLFASGFSIGGSMVWHLACQARLFRAHVPVGGDFWEPYPDPCPAGPANLLHIHGLADATFPLEGRSFRGGSFVQGNLFAGFAMLRDQAGCQRQPERMEQHGIFTLRAWDRSCRDGRRLAMALHPGGHELPPAWLPLAMEWLRAIP